MKTISFKPEFAERSLKSLRDIVGTAPERGYSINQVRLGVKVLDRVNSVTGEKVVLEDAEYDFVRDRINETTWVAADPFIVEFFDAVVSAS